MAWDERDYNRDSYEPSRPFGGVSSGYSIVTWLLGINCVVFVLDSIFAGSIRADAVSPESLGSFSIQKAIHDLQLWRWVTYQFLHGEFMHLLTNMIGLYFFGRLMESWWGSRRFVAFYLLCGMCGGVLFAIIGLVSPELIHDVGALRDHGIHPDEVQIVGASGSIFGILVGCAVLYPHRRVMLLFPPIPMSMRTMALVFLGFSILAVVVGSTNAGGDAAHLGGAVLGFFLVKKPQLLNFVHQGLVTQIAAKHRQRKAEHRRAQIAKQDAQVNRILDKVRNKGMHKLSPHERRILKQATERQRRVS